jgi:hypothetical protein
VFRNSEDLPEALQDDQSARAQILVSPDPQGENKRTVVLISVADP